MEKVLLEEISKHLGLTGVVILLLTVSSLGFIVTIYLDIRKFRSEVLKLQITMANQINVDLLSKRVTAYGELWSRMQPTAVYTKSGFGQNDAKELSENLSNWYFSATGGLFLTSRAREFYFSLQELLRVVSAEGNWKCDPRPLNPKEDFMELLHRLSTHADYTQFLTEAAKKSEKLTHLLPNNAYIEMMNEYPEKLDPESWRTICKAITNELKTSLKNGEPKAGTNAYVSIQQVASVLRTNLTQEIRSRLDVVWPESEDAITSKGAGLL